MGGGETSDTAVVLYKIKYPCGYNEKDRYMTYDSEKPESESFRTFRTEPQEGHDRCHPSVSPFTVRLDVNDLIINKPERIRIVDEEDCR